MLLPKEILAPGDYVTPDGMVKVTPRRLQHWHQSFQKMKAKGLVVPLPWEHQDDAQPLTRADRLANEAKHNAGFLDNTWIARDGRLWGMCDVPDQETADYVTKNVRFVSPEIKQEFTDGDGQTWQDVITHLALTPRPVFHRQKPFGSKAQMSSGTLQLSLADRKKGKKMTVKMGADCGTKKMGEDDSTTETPGSATDPDNKGADEPGVRETPEEYLDECKKLLADHGIPLPDHTTIETFLRDLCVALHAMKGKDAEMSEDDQTGDDVNNMNNDTSPKEEGISSMMMSLQTRVKTLEEHNSTLLAQQQVDRVNRFEREGRISPNDANEIRARIQKKRLSFADNADRDVLTIQIQLDQIGKVPKHTFGPAPKRMSQGRHTDGAEEQTGKTAWEDEGMTAERGKAAAEEQLRNSGIRPRN